MPATHRLELDQLLAPIAGEQPAGDSRAYAHRLRDRLHELRREDDPTAYDEATRPASWKHADWLGVLDLAEQALAAESKDIRVACHLAEALVHLDGLGGLREALQFLRRLSEDCWDRLNPPLEADDLETRAAPLANMLDDPVRGLCFPNLIRDLPLLGGSESGLSFSEWKRLRSGGDSESAARAGEVLHRCEPSQLQSVASDAEACLGELKALRELLDAKLGQHAPGFLHLEEAINDCYQLAGLALKEVGGAPVAAGDTAAEEAATEGDEARPPSGSTVLAAASPGDMLRSRQAAYQQIEQAANFLCQIEPHSPVPYLVKRAVGLSRLPFPQLIRQLVREENILSEMYRELGIDTSGGQAADVP